MSGAGGAERLEHDRIYGALSAGARAWLDELEIFDEVGSTNTHLVELARSRPVDGRVCLAERQTAGRGRRGRTWLSPAGRNIALSMGRRFETSAEELRSLSLAIGLAVIDAVGSFSVPGLGLKWPNDVLLGDAKLGGILIELVEAGDVSTVVVGIGLNVGSAELVRGAVDQPVADLLDARPEISRNALAARLINSVVDYAIEFERSGFAVMRDAWLGHHAYQRRPVRVLVGERSFRGVVRGVSEAGELEVDTGTTGLMRFNAGEVSLRDDS